MTSLVTIQVSNAVLPLAIFPFALWMVGADLYSKIVLSEVLSLFLLAIVLYNFEVDGVAQVVGLDPAQEVEKISRIFSGITYLRLLLFFCFAPLVILVALLIDRQLVVLVLCWLLVPLSYAIQPNWLYQGMEWNSPVAVVTALSRIAAVAVVLTMVDGERDYVLIPLTIGVLYLLGAVFTLLYAIHRFRIRFVAVAPKTLKQMLWSGKEVFLGNMSVILYRDANVIILSALGTPAPGIAAYSLAEKLVKAIQASIRPLNQFFFPRAIRLSLMAGIPSRRIFRELLKLTSPQLAILATLLLALMIAYPTLGIYIPWIQRIENASHVAFLIGLMSAATFFGVSNFMFGSAGLNTLGQRGYLLMAILSTGVINLISSALLVSVAGDVGAAISFVLAEATLFAMIARKYFQ